MWLFPIKLYFLDSHAIANFVCTEAAAQEMIRNENYFSCHEYTVRTDTITTILIANRCSRFNFIADSILEIVFKEKSKNTD